MVNLFFCLLIVVPLKSSFYFDRPLTDMLMAYILNNPYKNSRASVRISSSLPSEESAALRERKKRVEQTISRKLPFQQQDTKRPVKIPTIALCGSGGGYRALVAFLGTLLGLEESGLLDAISYIAGVSGSTWTMGTLFSHNKPIGELKELLKEQLYIPLKDNASYFKLAQILATKYLYNQNISLVDVWGALIAKALLSDLGEKRQSCLLSQQRKQVDTGEYPIPLYTAIALLDGQYEWIEMSPYEIGLISHRAFVPTWSFGRRFYGGVSQDFAPEQTLGFFMGVFGSAFTISEGEFIEDYKNHLPLSLFYMLKLLNTYTSFQYTRVSPALINNPVYGIESLKGNEQKEFFCFDAGFDCNLPLIPLLRPERQIDIIIICDATAGEAVGQELRKAEMYAKKNALPFPPIDYARAAENCISVFADPQKGAPTIIYLPLIQNRAFGDFDPQENIKSGGYCSTFNLRYTPEQTEELSSLTKYSLLESLEIIKSVIMNATEQS